MLRLTFRGDGWTALPVGTLLTRRAVRGATASLIPFGRCAGITLRGFAYPLKDASMRPGEIGVSNVVVSSPVTVRVRNGNMLLVLFDGAAAARRGIRW
jgi:thiamine pyrophosphokinase